MLTVPLVSPLLTRQQAANDFRADPMLYEACKDDAENLCKDVKHGGGRVQACLVGCDWQGGQKLRLMHGTYGQQQGLLKEYTQCLRRSAPAIA